MMKKLLITSGVVALVVSVFTVYALDVPGKVTDVYLPNMLETPEQLSPIGTKLDQAVPGDTIRFHVNGVGGNVDATLYLINKLKTTKAKTVMLVESPAYSGTAFIAAMGDELVYSPYSYLMFHTTSGFNVNCKGETGFDRAQLASTTCLTNLVAHLITVEATISGFKQIPNEVKREIIYGKTVICGVKGCFFFEDGATSPTVFSAPSKK